MNQNWILYVLLFHTFVSSTVRSEGTRDPFIFDPYTLQIYTLENIATSPHKGPFAVACPAETDEQKEFTEYNSLDGKALYVRFTYYKQNPPTTNFKCKETYRMAVAYHNSKYYGRVLEFGYEVYYQHDTFHKDFVEKDFNFEYGMAEEAFSKWKRFCQFFDRECVPSKFIKNFVWIPKIMFQYNKSDWGVKWVSRCIKKWKVDQFHKTCKNDDLGIRLFRLAEGQKYSDFYSKESQNKIFSKLQLPESVDGICKSENNCVKEYNILAPYLFETPISGPIECSNLTTIPIWYTRTKELLDYTEKFAIALSQTVGNIIREVTGVYGELTFSRKKKKKKKPKPVYLDSENERLLVPKIIYKIVTSTTADCDRFISTCRYAVVIVIHNGPQILSRDELCDDGCAEWGWDSIQYLSTTEKIEESSFVYCCELDKNMREKLNYPEDKSISGVLDLKSFKNHKGKDDSPNRQNPDIQKEVEGKMNELFNL